MVRQLEQAAQARMEDARLAMRVAGDVQVGPADVADQQRVAAEHKPRLLVPAPEVGDNVGVVRGRMSRRREPSHDRVAELYPVAVPERLVLKRDSGLHREVGCRARPSDELGKAGDVIGLNVGLEDSDDRRPGLLGSDEVLRHETLVRIDHRELPLTRAAEQVARAGGLRHEELSEDHAAVISSSTGTARRTQSPTGE